MRRRIKMLVSYDGTNYAGWQVQAGQGSVKTIQGTIEEGLSLLTQETELRVAGAGRTDAGVHARGQVFHFDTDSQIPLERFPVALNSVLPWDIRCHQAEEVGKDFHAQFSAIEKTYCYTIDQGAVPDVFLRNFVYHVPYTLELPAMDKAAGFLIGTLDFQSFCASGSSVKSYVRTIKQLDLVETGQLIFVNITADGFLYNMVRIIVGTLIEIGRGKMSPELLPEIIAARQRSLAGPTAPAKGLCLEQVFY